MTELEKAEEEIIKRTSELWQSKIGSEGDIERLYAEIESLVSAFEDLPRDQEDLLIMRQALRLYRKGYQQLDNGQLTWVEFEKLADQIRQDVTSAFDEDDLPWAPEDTIAEFVAGISKRREQDSKVWIEELESESKDLASMSAADANRLYSRAENPPPS